MPFTCLRLPYVATNLNLKRDNQFSSSLFCPHLTFLAHFLLLSASQLKISISFGLQLKLVFLEQRTWTWTDFTSLVHSILTNGSTCFHLNLYFLQNKQTNYPEIAVLKLKQTMMWHSPAKQMSKIFHLTLKRIQIQIL